MSNISKYNDSKPIEIRSIEQILKDEEDIRRKTFGHLSDEEYKIEQEMLTKYEDEIMQKNKDDCYANIATPILDRYKDIKDIME